MLSSVSPAASFKDRYNFAAKRAVTDPSVAADYYLSLARHCASSQWKNKDVEGLEPRWLPEELTPKGLSLAKLFTLDCQVGAIISSARYKEWVLRETADEMPHNVVELAGKIADHRGEPADVRLRLLDVLSVGRHISPSSYLKKAALYCELGNRHSARDQLTNAIRLNADSGYNFRHHAVKVAPFVKFIDELQVQFSEPGSVNVRGLMATASLYELLGSLGHDIDKTEMTKKAIAAMSKAQEHGANLDQLAVAYAEMHLPRLAAAVTIAATARDDNELDHKRFLVAAIYYHDAGQLDEVDSALNMAEQSGASTIDLALCAENMKFWTKAASYRERAADEIFSENGRRSVRASFKQIQSAVDAALKADDIELVNRLVVKSIERGDEPLAAIVGPHAGSVIAKAAVESAMAIFDRDPENRSHQFQRRTLVAAAIRRGIIADNGQSTQHMPSDGTQFYAFLPKNPLPADFDIETWRNTEPDVRDPSELRHGRAHRHAYDEAPRLRIDIDPQRFDELGFL